MARDADDSTQQGWTESNSSDFLDFGDIFVPSRDEQIGIICDLIPATVGEEFTAVELGAGGGTLAQAVLDTFRRSRYIALDGSEVMRSHLRNVLQQFADRVTIDGFRLEDRAWRNVLPSNVRCVLSSLVVHHLSDEEKRQLFHDLAARLEPGGALILADIVSPATPRIAELFAKEWDESVKKRSLDRSGNLKAYEFFRDEHWNYYDYPDPIDKPSRLIDQLDWLREAGFRDVDCFWMSAGHAVFGGYL